MTNSDSTPTCACGYDLTLQISQATGATTAAFRRMERRVADSEITKVGLALGMVAVWILLAYDGVEPVFGIITAVMGFHQFLLRGVKSVCGEWDLARITHDGPS